MPEAEAAVAIVCAREPERSILLIRRAERADDPWSGHWSFPGGHRGAQDADLLATALRELEEECGIRLGRDDLDAALPPTTAGRKVGRVLTVAPFVFVVERPMPAVLDSREAVEALWLPVSLLSDLSRHTMQPVPGMPPEQLFPAIGLPAVPLWGFTYRVLTEWLGIAGTDSDTG
jgi:8-oxo-dGTP pyrophosphatase MutT (NUDIX family)